MKNQVSVADTESHGPTQALSVKRNVGGQSKGATHPVGDESHGTES